MNKNIEIKGKQHSLALDVLKGLTICFVVISHSFFFGFENACFSPWRAILLSIDMPIFMLLAGYFSGSEITFDLQGIMAYWKKKSVQLLLPLILLPTLYCLINGITFEQILHDTHHGGYWFTWVLFLMFLLFWLVRLVASFLPKKQRPVGEIALALLSIVFVVWFDKYLLEADFELYKIISWAKMKYLYHCFVIGYFFRRYPKLADFFKRDEVWGITALLFFYFIHHQVEMRLGAHPSSAQGMQASFFGILTAWGAVHRMVTNSSNKVNRLFAYFGRESRSIYFMHFFFLFSIPTAGDYLRELYSRTGSTFSVEVLFSVLYGAWVIALSLVVIRMIRKNTLLELLCFGKKSNPKQGYDLSK